jgi:hypothetical protein
MKITCMTHDTTEEMEFDNADQLASWITAQTETKSVFNVIVSRPNYNSTQFFYGDPARGKTTVKDITDKGLDCQTYDAVEDALAAFLALLEA